MKKFSILIDLDRLKDPNNGLGQVAINFAEELSKRKYDDIEFTLLVPPRFEGKFGTNVRYEIISRKRRFLPWLCSSYDLWYTIHQDSWYFPSKSSTPYILTINDLNFLGEKKGLNRKYRLKRLQLKVNRAYLITTISNYTKEQVKKYLDIGNKVVQVSYCGVTVSTYANALKPAYVPEGDLLFTIGVIQPKKNFEVLIEFMQKLPEQFVLVIAGNKSGDYSGYLEQKIAELNLQHRIILPGLIPDEDKYWLYNHCKAVLFPSKLEGMGFPPVEAMRFGKPVFASTYSSIPEVSGDKAYYWENFDPAYMSSFFLEKMEEFNLDPIRPELLKEHSMKYTWEHNVEEYLTLFRKVLERRRAKC
jgi:glycosyltransferase involved in cell wall biosynthesis